MSIWEVKDNCGLKCPAPNVCWTPIHFTEPDVCWPPGLNPNALPPHVSIPTDHFIVILVLIFLGALFSGILIGVLALKLFGLRFWTNCCSKTAPTMPNFRRYTSSIRRSFRQLRRNQQQPTPHISSASGFDHPVHFCREPPVVYLPLSQRLNLPRPASSYLPSIHEQSTNPGASHFV